MDTLDAKELRILMTPQQGPCVTVFLPTHVSGEAGQQDMPRLKNLLDQAEEQLVNAGLRPTVAREMLSPARQLPDDPTYWDARSQGLAIFVGPDGSQHYRLPWTFDELVVVAQRFIIRPLLPLLSGPTGFLILALSQHKVQFFKADRERIEPFDVPGLPTRMEDALNYTSTDRHRQVHSAMKGRLGKESAVFHGQGGQADTRKDDIEHFFRMVDSALHPLLHDEQAPLLLAGVENLLPIYRRVNHYPHVAEAELHGNCDYLTPHEIHERAWPVVEPDVDHACKETAASYQQKLGTDRAIGDLKQILSAAREGRVDVLFIDQMAQRWGIAGMEPDDVQVHDKRCPGDDDLLDLAAVDTLRHRGKVYAVAPREMPIAEPAVALLRY